ncbi:TolC family protein [Acidovorax sp.]|uniref:TolC family protein n=1 Tax=Acidovorax sp. TaxID=1872122 RepID=UPI002612751F|nr:TolC family protein [Acidovorax sp.]
MTPHTTPRRKSRAGEALLRLATTAPLALAALAAQAEPLAFGAALQQLGQRSDQLAASRHAVESAQLRRDAMQRLGGPVVNLTGAAYAYNANLDVDLNPLNRALPGVLSQLPPQLAAPLAQMPHLPSSYTLNRSKSDTTASVSAFWPLYMGGASEAARGLLDAKTQEAEADAAKVGDEATTLLVLRYFGAQLAERAAVLREAALATIEQHDAAAQKMLDAGVIARVERLQARSALEEARRNARKARDDAELAATALTRTLKAADRVTPTSPLFVLGQPLEALPRFIDTALARHPGLSKVAAKKEQATQLHAAQEALRKPQVFVFGQRQLKTGREADWVAGVGVRWTLWDSIDRDALAESSNRQIEQAERTGAQAQNDIALLVEKRWLGVEQARRQFLALAPGLELADEVLRLRTSGLKAGTSTTLDLIDAQVNQAKAQTERAQAAHDYVKALAELLESCGLSEDFGKYMARADALKVE